MPACERSSGDLLPRGRVEAFVEKHIIPLWPQAEAGLTRGNWRDGLGAYGGRDDFA